MHQRAAGYAGANGLDPTFIKKVYDLIIGETCRIEDLIINADAEPPVPVSGVQRSDRSRVPCA